MIQVLRYTRELEDVGFEPEQAKASVKIWMELMDQDFAKKADIKEYFFMIQTEIKVLEAKNDSKTEQLDTKFDAKIENLESRINARFENFESKFNAKIENLESRINAKIENLESRINAKIENLGRGLLIQFVLINASLLSIMAFINNYFK